MIGYDHYDVGFHLYLATDLVSFLGRTRSRRCTKAANSAFASGGEVLLCEKLEPKHTKEVRQQFYKMARKTGYPQEKFVPEFTAREQELIEYFGNRYINLYKPWLDKEI